LTERALNTEMDHHLAGEDGAGNSRNGYGRKTVTIATGKLEIDVPRDRHSSFDPHQPAWTLAEIGIIAVHDRRLYRRAPTTKH
jgi:transposase-like protein